MITVIQGAQWGSEAKGTVAAWYAHNMHVAVRTGSINAGHTFYYKGQPVVMQQLPCAWHNPDCQLVIGAGAYIHLPTLERELAMIKDLTGEDLVESGRLLIDYRAGVHHDEFAQMSRDFGRSAKIGATGKGCAEAVIHKIKNRNAGHELPTTFADTPGAEIYPTMDTADYLAWADNRGFDIMLEGTQGQHLDLHFGPYPFTTNRQTIPAIWVAECGLAPTRQIETVLVARTYPIRVAGNSGPMQNETTWPNLARHINDRLRHLGREAMIDNHCIEQWENHLLSVLANHGCPITDPGHYDDKQRQDHGAEMLDAISKAWDTLDDHPKSELSHLFEVTTVTKRLRRIAKMDRLDLEKVVRRENPSGVVLTFFNYEFPELWGATDAQQLEDEHYLWIERLEKETGSKVLAVGCGPEEQHFVVPEGSGPSTEIAGIRWRRGMKVRNTNEYSGGKFGLRGMVEDFDRQQGKVQVRWHDDRPPIHPNREMSQKKYAYWHYPGDLEIVH